MSLVVVALCLSLASSWCRAATEGALPTETVATTLDDVLQAWDHRAKGAKSARIKWIESRNEEKGSVLSPIFGNLPAPLKDTQYEVPSELRLDGIRMHYSVVDQADYKGKRVTREYVAAFDGEKSVIFGPNREGSYLNGTIRNENHNSDISVVFLMPLLRCLRPLEPALGGYSPSKLRLVPTGAKIGDDPVVVVEAERSPGRKYYYTLYCDPKQGFAIRRLTAGNDRFKSTVVDIKHRRDANDMWVPESWRIVRRQRPDGPAVSIDGKVIEMTLNPAIPLEEFQVQFPLGAWVVDVRKDEEYIVRPDGKRRIFTRKEMFGGATYEQLLNSESGEAIRAKAR